MSLSKKFHSENEMALIPFVTLGMFMTNYLQFFPTIMAQKFEMQQFYRITIVLLQPSFKFLSGTKTIFPQFKQDVVVSIAFITNSYT